MLELSSSWWLYGLFWIIPLIVPGVNVLFLIGSRTQVPWILAKLRKGYAVFMKAVTKYLCRGRRRCYVCACEYACCKCGWWYIASLGWISKPQSTLGCPGFSWFISSSPVQSSLYPLSPEKGHTGKRGLANEFLTNLIQVSRVFIFSNHSLHKTCYYKDSKQDPQASGKGSETSQKMSVASIFTVFSKLLPEALRMPYTS